MFCGLFICSWWMTHRGIKLNMSCLACLKHSLLIYCVRLSGETTQWCSHFHSVHPSRWIPLNSGFLPRKSGHLSLSGFMDSASKLWGQKLIVQKIYSSFSNITLPPTSFSLAWHREQYKYLHNSSFIPEWWRNCSSFQLGLAILHLHYPLEKVIGYYVASRKQLITLKYLWYNI